MISVSFPGAVSAGPPELRVALSKYPLEVMEISLPDYLPGVLSQEVPASWPTEILKAQAVAARTYALYRRNHPRNQRYDLESGVGDQVFRAHTGFSDSVQKAVRSTRGEVLMRAGKIIPSFFHSCCGGQTASAADTWSWANTVNYYPVQKDPYCSDCHHSQWEYEISKDELNLLLASRGLIHGEILQILLDRESSGHRVATATIVTTHGTRSIGSNRFREILGFSRLRSAAFNLMEFGDSFIFIGSGAGHGVGLCQWGGYEMAQRGKNYREILNFYYPNIQIKRVY